MNTPIEVKKRKIQDLDIFEFHGELDETNADKIFTAIYSTIGEFKGKKVAFNFIGLKYLNSKSIGYIADIFSNIEDGGGAMYLCDLSDEVRDTLGLVGITEIICTLPTEADVLAQAGIKVASAPTTLPNAA